MDALFSMNSRQCYSSLCHGQGAPKPVYLIKQHIGANGRKKAWGSNPPDRSCCRKSTKSIHSSLASNSAATLSTMASIGRGGKVDTRDREVGYTGILFLLSKISLVANDKTGQLGASSGAEELQMGRVLDDPTDAATGR